MLAQMIARNASQIPKFNFAQAYVNPVKNPSKHCYMNTFFGDLYDSYYGPGEFDIGYTNDLHEPYTYVGQIYEIYFNFLRQRYPQVLEEIQPKTKLGYINPFDYEKQKQLFLESNGTKEIALPEQLDQHLLANFHENNDKLSNDYQKFEHNLLKGVTYFWNDYEVDFNSHVPELVRALDEGIIVKDSKWTYIYEQQERRIHTSYLNNIDFNTTQICEFPFVYNNVIQQLIKQSNYGLGSKVVGPKSLVEQEIADHNKPITGVQSLNDGRPENGNAINSFLKSLHSF